MSELNVHWNNLELPQPPQTTIILPSNSGVNIALFVSSMNDLDSLLKRVNLEYAGALCSRLIYKSKLKFRTTKWLQLIEKINGTLLKVLRMKLNPILKIITESTCSTNNQLPSQPMLEWLLIKLQGFARLLVRLVITSHRVGVVFHQCLSIGHNWHIIIVLMSLAGQIWTNCQLLLNQTFKSYSVAYKIMKSLPEHKQWNSGSLPKDLARWITEEINLLGLEVADIFKIYLPQMKNSVSNEVQTTSHDEGVHPITKLNNFEDLGEIIFRDDLFTKPCLENPEEPTSTSVMEEGALDINNITPKDIKTKRKKVLNKTKKKKIKIKNVDQSIEHESAIILNTGENEVNDGTTTFLNEQIGKKKKKKKSRDNIKDFLEKSTEENKVIDSTKKILNGMVRNKKNKRKKILKSKNNDLEEKSTRISPIEIKKHRNKDGIFLGDKITHKKLISKRFEKLLKNREKNISTKTKTVILSEENDSRNFLWGPIEKLEVNKSNSSSSQAKLKRKPSVPHSESTLLVRKKKKAKTNVLAESAGRVKRSEEKLKIKHKGKRKKSFNIFNIETIV